VFVGQVKVQGGCEKRVVQCEPTLLRMTSVRTAPRSLWSRRHVVGRQKSSFGMSVGRLAVMSSRSRTVWLSSDPSKRISILRHFIGRERPPWKSPLAGRRRSSRRPAAPLLPRRPVPTSWFVKVPFYCQGYDGKGLETIRCVTERSRHAVSYYDGHDWFFLNR
jgi:hypothetical protein